jgi:hypothetical protein
MLRVGFDPMIPALERAKTVHAVTVIGPHILVFFKIAHQKQNSYKKIYIRFTAHTSSDLLNIYRIRNMTLFSKTLTVSEIVSIFSY